jgi:hypothetical protein
MPEGSTSSNTANAGATSTQTNPTNVNTSVRVNSPGNEGAVNQSNSSNATAAAGASGGPGSSATSSPTATSTQTNPSNINVSVRVGSPGNNGPVNQTNSSNATAANVDPTDIEPAVADLPDDPNSQAAVINESGMIQDIAQCGNDEDHCVTGPGSDGSSGADGLTSAADQSSATATQVNPSNINVNIRVASPGEDGYVSQLNEVNAVGATRVTTQTNPENLVVGINIPGDPSSVVIPTDVDTPWIWNWNWTTGTAPTDPSATPFDSPNWNWDWTVPAGAVPASAPINSPNTPAPTPGQWTWTWIWTRGDGWTTTWTYTQACACTWNWVWTWNWPGDVQSTPQTAKPPAQAPAAPANPQVSQTNETNAAAVAVTAFDPQQSTSMISGGGSMDAIRYQGISNTQQATANADAIQVEPLNLNIVTAGRIRKVTQSNQAIAASTAASLEAASQTINQTQTGTNDGATHKVIGIQVSDTQQSATADSSAAQTRVSNINHIWSQTPFQQAWIDTITQTNVAVTSSYNDNWSFVTQTIDQSQFGEGANQSSLAVQVASTSQQGHSYSSVAQSDVRNRTSIEIPWNGLYQPPITQTHIVSSGSTVTNYSEITQSSLQVASGEDVEWDQRSTQTATVKQGGSATSGASQTRLENFAGWSGTLISPAGPTSGGSGGGGVSLGGAPVLPEPTIFGAPPLEPFGITAGAVHLFGLSSAGPVVHKSFGHGGVDASQTPARAPARAAVAHQAPGASGYQYVVMNLLSAVARALLLLLGATPFAALLALFTIAALGVGRLQYAVPALGRSADFARRERPG